MARRARKIPKISAASRARRTLRSSERLAGRLHRRTDGQGSRLRPDVPGHGITEISPSAPMVPSRPRYPFSLTAIAAYVAADAPAGSWGWSGKSRRVSAVPGLRCLPHGDETGLRVALLPEAPAPELTNDLPQFHDRHFGVIGAWISLMQERIAKALNCSGCRFAARVQRAG